MLWNIVLMVVLVFVMVLASGVAIDSFEQAAKWLKTKKLLLASILLGFSTSLPELFVGIASSIKGEGQISLGNIIGANLANLSWIAGGAAMVVGAIPVVGEYLRKDLWVTMGISMIPFLMMTDGSLTRFDGVILILIYLLYINELLTNKSGKTKHLKMLNKPVNHRFKTKEERALIVVKLLISLGVLAFCAALLVDVAIKIAVTLGVSLFWVGLLAISFGTTLPELILSVVGTERREISLVLGNLLGSVVVNSTLILGIVAIINPIIFEESAQKGLSGIFLVFILGLFWLFTKSKHKLERWEGAVLIGIYLMFVGLQFLFA